MKKKLKIKKLSLKFPFDRPKTGFISWIDCVKEENRIEPIFKSNGYYLDRETDITWLEINGEAWKYNSRKDFEFKLNTGEFECLYDDVYEALNVLHKNRLLTKKQKQVLYYQDCIRSCKLVSRNAKKMGLGFKRRAVAFIRKQNDKNNTSSISS